MKQSDVFSIILVASIGTFAAFFICKSLMGDPDSLQVKFTKMREVISDKLVEPNAEVFNSTAINPTIEVYVGDCEDIDKNGILDDEEISICRCDTDRDGMLNDEEIRICELQKRCDLNGDGTVSGDDEMACMNTESSADENGGEGE